MNRYEQDQQREDAAAEGEHTYFTGIIAELIDNVDDLLPYLTPDDMTKISRLLIAEAVKRDPQRKYPEVEF